MSIASNLNSIKATLPENVTLVAVSKTKPVSDLMEAYEAGQRIFGENKIQEMADKWKQMPKDIQWHMIGHVQTNKVKFMAPFVSLIHGVDSLKLLQEINKQAAKNNRVIDCLLQMHIAEEETKFGLDENELNALLSSTEFKEMQHIRILGLMGMATFTENQNQIRKEFIYLKYIFDSLRNRDAQQHGGRDTHSRDAQQCISTSISTISMGMSGDYQLAIECGSTMVRIGSSIFGGR
ncbi:YggS family pyridoxal phosphate-dependent enzyme [Flavobacterium sp. Fl-318]|uniref:Pyridoxal phosphate homeostasis protein n=1 Tax=Flavobacterium cupriresistens TaxID=2893885 RepID=A0ABU4RAJ2_9FLAO|nr:MULTISPECIES: YggS family pyridoxal phosphate-dependent enzyme [unclassified Flavobacterium]MDX6189607.1 YggS family pyridoxal phosphate-dependent enzyme [Flavobacterium sp. Fl-318]UFH40986.1 YggS family pyridoxal phosphate-dependent enzyme [Flavobacterium sp. F-323]